MTDRSHMNTYQGGGTSQWKTIPIKRHAASLILGIFYHNFSAALNIIFINSVVNRPWISRKNVVFWINVPSREYYR